MKHLHNILDGFSNVFSGFQQREYASDGGFRADAENMRGDVKTLGKDFTKSAETIYGQATADAGKKPQRQ
ncbi:hypothetical protein [Aeromonas simiae]|uniref:hypothetical protein n=1 Tax=Aeromonas simiae TaxID=218936 RepID=UPI00266BEAD9|nr:hypothetical protein [Aeromonas simiae]MDO2950578.1 hypothetical protein [Aeromonas simiae]